jgi:TolB-like protein/DNA-binding winged helix-turn-helix (wHTH) protein
VGRNARVKRSGATHAARVIVAAPIRCSKSVGKVISGRPAGTMRSGGRSMYCNARSPGDGPPRWPAFMAVGHGSTLPRVVCDDMLCRSAMTNDAGMADRNGFHGEHGTIEGGRDIVAFGEFVAHLRSAELFRGQAPVKLQLQPFRVLAALLKRPGELVTREELRREVWGDHTAVDFEHGLNFCIKQVRAALGDDAEHPSFVETLPRRGYRFIGSIEGAPPLATSAAEGRSASGASEAPRAPSPRVAWLAFAGVLIASFTLAVFALRARSVRDPNAAAVVFVVPFENMTGDRESDVWCDGLTEEIIAELASADPRRVHVIARTTAMAYRAARRPLREIAGEVKADYALEGAVRRAGDRFRVTAQLYRLKEETPVWAKAFETTGNDVLSVQRTLAAHLAGSLALAFNAAEQRPPPPTDAQDALAKARYLRNKADPAATLASLTAFEEALRLDPENATAWSELAVAYEAAAGVLPASQALDQSCAAAKRALELSSEEALADAALGLCTFQRDWDWAAAESAFDRALAKSPGLAAAHHFRAVLLSAAGRHGDAIRAIERAKSLDPLSPAVVADAGWHAYLARAYPAAIREFTRTLELEPKETWAREHLMMARALSGDADGAAKEAKSWVAMFPLSDEEKAALAPPAPPDVVRRALEVVASHLAARAKSDERPNPGFIAAKYAGAGDAAQALVWLERAAVEHAPWFLPILRDPRFDLVSADPRFSALLKRAHVPAIDTPRSSGAPRSVDTRP